MLALVRHNWRVAAAVLLGALLAALPASAQSVVDARRVEFTPSVDHAAVDANGVPLVQRYSLQLFVEGGITPVQTVDLGKPVPGADGMIRVDFVALLSSPLDPGVIYEAIVETVGPGGNSAAPRSNTFAFSAPCAAPSISPVTQSFTAAGGTGGSTVTAGAGCAWTAVSNAAWISVTGGATGSGSGPVSFSVAANTVTTSRTGTLTIAGATFSVTQAAANCTFSIAPTSQSFTAAGGTGSSTVTAGAGCAWTAVSNAAWITVTGGATGSGSGPVSFSVAANTVTTSRTGTLTIAGATFSVTQAAANCTFSISPTSQSFPAAAGTGTSAVTAGAGCAWTAVSNAAWITVTGGATGSGSGPVSFSVAANTVTTSRTGTLTIAGATFSVTQAAASCTFSISPASQSFPAAAGTGSSAVTAGTGCAWTAVSSASWITITNGASGSASGPVSFNVASNTTATNRSGTLTIAGRTFTVTQAAPGCATGISPASRSHTAAGSMGSVDVIAPAGCSWASASNVDWIVMFLGGSGTGSGSVAYSVASYTGSATRTGTLTIAGQIFTVTQSGACTFSLSRASLNVGPAAATGSVTVTTQPGCAWSSTGGTAWIALTGGGTGSGTVNYSVTANIGTAARSATLTIAGIAVGVRQSARPTTPSNVRIMR